MTETEEMKLLSILKEHNRRRPSISAFGIWCLIAFGWILLVTYVMPMEKIDELIGLTLEPSDILFFIVILWGYFLGTRFDKKRSENEFINSSIAADFSKTTAQVFLAKIETQIKYLKEK